MSGKKILLADDDNVTLETIGAQLRGVGYQVVTAMDAMQAFMAAQRTSPDVVLLDIQMPGGTGLDTLKRLHASTNTQAIPVIAISAHPKLGPQAMPLGPAELLAKPADLEL